MKVLYWAIFFSLIFNFNFSNAEPPPTGEPYKLNGKRLVFTNWTYIRPGDVGWIDKTGKSVYADKNAKLGPFDADWNPQDHIPWGIRIKALKPSEIKIHEINNEYSWELGGKISIGSIVFDNGIYKAWGSCKAGNCYLESKDGIKWERPKLGLVEYEGSRDNNLIPSAPPGRVFIDPNSKNERYKCVFEQSDKITYEGFKEYIKRYPSDWSPNSIRKVDGKPIIVSLGGAVSSDGFRWITLDEPILMEHCDTDNIGYYNSQIQKYTAYVRTWNALIRAPNQPIKETTLDTWFPASRRSIAISVTDDFRHFRKSSMILEPGPEMPPSDDIYTNCFTWIPGSPELFLMFPALFHRFNDTTSIACASSSDGINWHWIPEGMNLIDTASFGEWNGGCIFAFPPLMELGDGSFALRFSANDVPHKYPRGILKSETGIAIWPHGRIFVLEAPEKGEFATVAFVPNGNKLFINARTKRAGSIRVAVNRGLRDSEFTMEHDWYKIMGKAISDREFENSIPIIGDHVRTQVRWNNADDLGVKSDEPVVLIFKLEQAEIFALEFE